MEVAFHLLDTHSLQDKACNLSAQYSVYGYADIFLHENSASSPSSESRAPLVRSSLNGATPKKVLSSHKTSVMHSGHQPVSRMVAVSVSPRQNAARSSVQRDCVHARDVSPIIFLRKSKTINNDGQEAIDHDLDIEDSSGSSHMAERIEWVFCVIMCLA
jgi:hypothetical protein